MNHGVSICVIGAGYVGLTTAACMAAIGHEVACSDADADKIVGLQSGRLPIYEERLPELVAQSVAAGRLQFSSDTAVALAGAEAVFVCVGTPPDSDGKANMAAVESVARQIAEHSNGYKLVVGKSTVPVHTGRKVKKILASCGRTKASFDVASNPEFLREGTGVLDFFHPDRIVVGCDSERGNRLLRQIYAPVLQRSGYCGWHDRPLSECSRKTPAWVATNIASAELIKHASNSFLAMKISYANAIADVCELAGAEAEEVLYGIGLDHRIGREFLRPGIGFGGFCFPKDLSAFVEMSRDLGYDFSLLREVQAINERRPAQFVRAVREALWVVEGKTIGILGLAFKAATDDTRLSPAYAVTRELIRLGAKLRAYDPKAMERAREELGRSVEYCANAEDVAKGADAVLVLTEWPEFSQVDWSTMGASMRRRLVLDGRNLLDRGELERLGFEYYGIGRPRRSQPTVLLASTPA